MSRRTHLGHLAPLHTERVARAGWASIYEMIDGHREHAATAADAELAAMLLKDAATYEAVVLERARAAIREVLAVMREPSALLGRRSPEVRRHIDSFLYAFAREHGIDPPPAEEQRP